MRICIFSRLTPDHRVYAPPVHGRLDKVFRELGHEVIILTTARPNGQSEVKETEDATIHFLPNTTPNKLNDKFWRASAQAFDLLHSQKPFDLVLGRGVATLGFHQFSAASAQVPAIAHEGTYPLWLNQLERWLPFAAVALAAPFSLLRLPLGKRYRNCLLRAKIVVCNSQALAVALRRVNWWNPPKTECIPYGFDLQPWEAIGSVAPRQVPPRLMFVGRLTPDKGAFDLVDILAKISDKTATIEAIGPVTDEMAKRLRKLAKSKGVADRFLISGPERNENLPKRLLGASAFIFPSTHPEGLSKSVMEAMAAALPVFAYRIAGMDALVKDGETGWLLPSGNTAAMAKRLDQLLSDPTTSRRMGGAARERLRSHFSKEAAAARWTDLFTRVTS